VFWFIFGANPDPSDTPSPRAIATKSSGSKQLSCRLLAYPLLLNLDGKLRNVTQSNGDCCAKSGAPAAGSPQSQSFLDKHDLACGLQIINADGL
jgi:hypothetical protein